MKILRWLVSLAKKWRDDWKYKTGFSQRKRIVHGKAVRCSDRALV